MKLNRTVHAAVIVTTGLVTLCVCAAMPAKGDDLGELLNRSAEVVANETQSIRDEMNSLQRSIGDDIQDQMQVINGYSLSLRQPMVVREQEIERLRRRLKVLEKIQSYADSDDAGRAHKMTVATKELTRLHQVQSDVMKPTRARLQKLAQKYSAKHVALANAMTPFFREADDTEQIQRDAVYAAFQDATARAGYVKDDTVILTATIVYRPKVQGRVIRPVESLGDDIDLLRVSRQQAIVRAGRFDVSIQLVPSETWDEKRTRNAIQRLVDLPGLVRLHANAK